MRSWSTGSLTREVFHETSPDHRGARRRHRDGRPATATANAARPQVESYSLSGVLAEASYKAEGEPQLNELFALTVVGADATLRSHLRGVKPVSEPQVSLVAAVLVRPGAEPGDEPVPVELWGVSENPTFVYDRVLSQATLQFDCVGEFLDPTNDDTPTGETLDLSVAVTWTGVGPLQREQQRSRTTDLGSWTLERSNARYRLADAHITVTSPDGTLFDGPAQAARISEVRAGTLIHSRG